MEQTSHIRVERHESVLSWTLNGLNDFPWHEGNFLKSDEIKFEGIDVSWHLKYYPATISNQQTDESFERYFLGLVVNDNASSGGNAFIKASVSRGEESPIIVKNFAVTTNKEKLILLPDYYGDDVNAFFESVCHGSNKLKVKLEYSIFHATQQEAAIFGNEQTTEFESMEVANESDDQTKQRNERLAECIIKLLSQDVKDTNVRPTAPKSFWVMLLARELKSEKLMELAMKEIRTMSTEATLKQLMNSEEYQVVQHHRQGYHQETIEKM